MMEKLNRKFIVLLVSAILFFVSLNTAYALICGGNCYASGVCYNNVWYEGCKDSSNNLYKPDELLGECLICKCDAVDKTCKWQPSHQVCQSKYRDLLCTYIGSPPASSSCTDRDTSLALCTDATCPNSGAWAKAGELSTIYQPAIWEYTLKDKTTFECCGDDSSEKYITSLLESAPYSACCDDIADCVDIDGTCISNNGVAKSGTYKCSSGTWVKNCIGKTLNGVCDTTCGAPSQCQGIISSCSIYGGYCTPECVHQADDDNSPSACNCIAGPGRWNIGGEVAACCYYNDANEFTIPQTPGCTDPGCGGIGSTDKWPDLVPGGYACCNNKNDCVYNDVCYTSNADKAGPYDLGLSPSDTIVICEPYNGRGTWFDCDNSQGACTEPKANGRCGLKWVAGGEAYAFGEYNTGISAECCGDDDGEFYRSTVIRTAPYSACCDDPSECVDTSYACREGVDENLIPGGCLDGADNDCNGDIDCDDTNCQNTEDCCTTINRECKEYEDDLVPGGESAREKFEYGHKNYYKRGNTTHRGAILAQVVNGKYYACVPDAADSACCANPSSCVYNGICYDDREKLDVDADGITEVCVASSPGKWVDGFETDCSNAIDDDFDGLIDCEDPDCAGSISGRVQGTDSKNIEGARVDAVQGATPQYTQFTQPSGKYQIDNALCGTYDMIASKAGYVSSTANANLPPRESIIVDFTLVIGSTCEDDCTYAGDNIIHKECDEINGCKFCDPALRCSFCNKQKVAEACDLAQPGWIRSYLDPVNCPQGCEIECAENCPQPKTKVKAEVTCTEENLIKTTKLVNYKGKLVKLVIVTCG